jgi:two-component system osmolarity sensor histidine kinase EnvZ
MPEKRRRAPSSLLTRTNFTLGVSSILIAVIATIALYVFVIDPIAERSADDEAALVELSAKTWVELQPDARSAFELEMAFEHDLIISAAREDLPVFDSYVPYVDLLREKISERLGVEVEFLAGDELMWVDVPMGGYDLQIGMAPDRRAIQPLYVAIVIVGLGAAIVFGTSLLIVQRIARPLVKIAEQAEEFRGAGDMEPLPEEGPRELVSLARNFNTMAQEISTLLSNRTTLLAGISHDLRTPLTRMRLALELLPDTVDASLRERFERNLESMDELISDALRFARGAGEVAQEVELVGFVRDVLASFEQPVELETNVDPAHRVFVAPSAFRRVLINLVANGYKHGKNVRVRLNANVVRVIDDGPGIPPEYREKVFQPFFRLDESRSRLTGGSGLGLAIVQQLCEAHGWRIGIEEGDPRGASSEENGSKAGEETTGTTVWLAFA